MGVRAERKTRSIRSGVSYFAAQGWKWGWKRFFPRKKDLDFLHPSPYFYCGAPGEIRTHGLWLRRPTLYPTELRAHKNISDMLCAGGCQGQPPMPAAKGRNHGNRAASIRGADNQRKACEASVRHLCGYSCLQRVTRCIATPSCAACVARLRTAAMWGKNMPKGPRAPMICEVKNACAIFLWV